MIPYLLVFAVSNAPLHRDGTCSSCVTDIPIPSRIDAGGGGLKALEAAFDFAPLLAAGVGAAAALAVFLAFAAVARLRGR